MLRSYGGLEKAVSRQAYLTASIQGTSISIQGTKGYLLPYTSYKIYMNDREDQRFRNLWSLMEGIDARTQIGALLEHQHTMISQRHSKVGRHAYYYPPGSITTISIVCNQASQFPCNLRAHSSYSQSLQTCIISILLVIARASLLLRSRTTQGNKRL